MNVNVPVDAGEQLCWPPVKENVCKPHIYSIYSVVNNILKYGSVSLFWNFLRNHQIRKSANKESLIMHMG